jgi:hypothetical protein
MNQWQGHAPLLFVALWRWFKRSKSVVWVIAASCWFCCNKNPNKTRKTAIAGGHYSTGF